jgi:hypothetical protein
LQLVQLDRELQRIDRPVLLADVAGHLRSATWLHLELVSAR